MAQITQANDAQWHSDRALVRKDRTLLKSTTLLPQKSNVRAIAKLPNAKIEFIEPMLADSVTTLPEGDQWQ